MKKSQYDVIIVGAGPSGIFTALQLVNSGKKLDILIVEKGRSLKERSCPMKTHNTKCVKCTHCAIVSGWGGAGAFSDGKLTLSTEIGGHMPEYIGHDRLWEYIQTADRTYLRFGATERIFGPSAERIDEVSDQAIHAGLKFIPARLRHLGTGYSMVVLQGMMDYLMEHGVEVVLGQRVMELLTENGEVKGVKLKDETVLEARYVAVAPGRENAEWLSKEAGRLGLCMSVNPVDIGVRVEMPATIMKELTEDLYESKLVYYSEKFEDKVRTFCMCPNGEVVNENNQGLITVNGHSHAHIKTRNTNFALLVSKNFTEPFKEPITYGKYIATLANLLGGGVIVQKLGDLLLGRRSTDDRIQKGLTVPTLRDATPGDLSLVFPYRHLDAIVGMLKALDRMAPGVYSRDTLLYGVEVKFYSSRIKVNNSLETAIKNLYTGGDGAGITRGLMQASASGMVIADDILRKEG